MEKNIISQKNLVSCHQKKLQTQTPRLAKCNRGTTQTLIIWRKGTIIIIAQREAGQQCKGATTWSMWQQQHEGKR